MSNATQPQTDKPLIESIEQANCPACDSVIARHHVFTNIEQKPEGLRRTVKAYCVHCDKGWIATQKLLGGTWSDDQRGGTTKELTSQQLAGLKARVDHVDGTRQVEALSA